LLDKHIEVYHHFEQHFLTSTDVRAKYALRHNQLIDYWSLCGDPGNNIKGVPGVGKKTALLLLEKFDSLDEVLAQARGLAQDQAADSGLAVYQKSLSKVLQFEDEAVKCRLLLTPKLDVELGINLKIFRLA
jgi:DNA polymerase-1